MQRAMLINRLGRLLSPSILDGEINCPVTNDDTPSMKESKSSGSILDIDFKTKEMNLLMNAKQLLLAGLLGTTVILAGCSTGVKESATEIKYPVKPITVIAPAAAGGTTDTIARVLEKSALQHFGQPFVVINKPGGAATIGMNELASASPDGYTIGIIPVSVMLQPLYGPTRYHYPTALEPLARVATAPAIIATLAEQPWKNISQLVAYAKEHPGEIKFGHAGLGSSPHITGEMFART